MSAERDEVAPGVVDRVVALVGDRPGLTHGLMLLNFTERYGDPDESARATAAKRRLRELVQSRTGTAPRDASELLAVLDRVLPGNPGLMREIRELVERETVTMGNNHDATGVD